MCHQFVDEGAIDLFEDVSFSLSRPFFARIADVADFHNELRFFDLILLLFSNLVNACLVKAFAVENFCRASLHIIS